MLSSFLRDIPSKTILNIIFNVGKNPSALLIISYWDLYAVIESFYLFLLN